jgi:hypothetical protein
MNPYEQIEKLISKTETISGLSNIMSDINTVMTLVKRKHHEKVMQKIAEDKQEKIKALKKLRPQTKVYSRSMDSELLGKTLFKIRDGKDRMLVQGPKGQWRVPYIHLQDHPMNESELALAGILLTRP